MKTQNNDDPYRPHSHEPNPRPPTEDPAFWLELPSGRRQRVGLAELQALPATKMMDCFIVSTGHGTTGPFVFDGVALLELLEAFVSESWTEAEVVSADGFGNRVTKRELKNPGPAGPILLAYGINGRPLTREAGLVRMIVKQEKDDALRQVKWIALIRLLAMN